MHPKERRPMAAEVWLNDDPRQALRSLLDFAGFQ